MSNKNLKVYQIEFITQLKKLYFNVKFPCQIKVTWKRSNETAESTLVPLQNGVVNFNQTLRLSVNMYFDMTTNKFVEKKCAYSFLISTEKGQKSAGHVHLDLAQFFNKRIYQMDQSFVLEKCPVAGTKVDMKIHYEEDTKQKGYDSMSCISATNPLDSSVASVDLSDLASKSGLASKSELSEKFSESQTEKSSKSDKTLSESEIGLKKQEVFDKLDVSDIIESSPSATLKSDGSKIGENIKNINTLTSKINEFVNNKSKNIRFQVEGFRRKISQLQEEVQNQRFAKQKLQKQLQEERKKYSILNREFSDFKTDAQHKLQVSERRTTQIQSKFLSNQAMISQLEERMNQSGESQSAYIDQLKSNAKSSQQKLSLEIRQLKENLVQQKKSRNEQHSKIEQLQGAVKSLRSKYQAEVDKNSSTEQNLRRKEMEIEQTRINLQKAFENLVNSLNTIF